MSRSQHAWYHPRRWPSLLVFLVATVVVVIMAGVITSVGIRMAGSLAAWRAGMEDVAPMLLGWRLLCYGGIAWLWLRRWKPRVVARLNEDRDGGVRARHKLARLEVVSVAFIVAIELINLANWLGGL